MSKLNLSNVRKVASWELVKGLKAPTFLIMTLLIPGMMLIMSGVNYLSHRSNLESVSQIAVVDHTPDFFSYLPQESNDNIQFHLVEPTDDYESILADQGYNGVIEISEEAIGNSTIPVFVDDLSKFDNALVRNPLNQALAHYRLSKLNIDIATVQPAIAPVSFHTQIIFKGESQELSLASVLVPTIAAVLLIVSTAISGQVLMYGVIKEKRNRVVEILLSSISSLDLFVGKIVGFGLMSLLQILIWVAVASALAPLVFDLGELALTFADLAWPIIFFIFGFFLLASIFASLGATMKEAEEGSQIQGLVVLIPMVPLFLSSILLETPNALWARILSHLPPFIPSMVILRMSVTRLPLWELLTSLGMLTLSIALFSYLGSKIFQGGILQYDRNLSLKEIRSLLK